MNFRACRIAPRLVLSTGLALAFQAVSIAPAAAADEAVATDPKHYTVEFENEKIRVLRIKYGPKEKSAMHYHPANMAVMLTDGHIKFTMPDGSTGESEVKAGTVQWDAGGDHLPENLGDRPFELILVELKD